MIRYLYFLCLYSLLSNCNSSERPIACDNDFDMKINTYENHKLVVSTLYKDSLPKLVLGFSEADTINPENITAYIYKDKQLDSISTIKGENTLDEFLIYYERDFKFMIAELDKEGIDIHSYCTDPIGQELFIISTMFGFEEFNPSKSKRMTDTVVYNKRIVEIDFDSLNISPFIAKMNLFSESNILNQFRLETVDNKVVLSEIVLSDLIVMNEIFYNENHQVDNVITLIMDKNDLILEKITRNFEYFIYQK